MKAIHNRAQYIAFAIAAVFDMSKIKNESNSQHHWSRLDDFGAVFDISEKVQAESRNMLA